MNPISKRERPRLRSVLNYLLLVLAFGVVVPRLKGLEFFDPVLMSAYACIGMLFSGPATAQAFETKPSSFGEALRWIFQAVLFGEVIAAAMLVGGVLTVYLTHLRSLFFLPDLIQLATSAVVGADRICGSGEHGGMGDAAVLLWRGSGRVAICVFCTAGAVFSARAMVAGGGGFGHTDRTGCGRGILGPAAEGVESACDRNYRLNPPLN